MSEFRPCGQGLKGVVLSNLAKHQLNQSIQIKETRENEGLFLFVCVGELLAVFNNTKLL